MSCVSHAKVEGGGEKEGKGTCCLPGGWVCLLLSYMLCFGAC